MSEHHLLPLVDTPAPERRDAARNREALLRAAQRLVERCGADAVTMDAVAHEAGVGKGTVFRRFDSREGLMAALLDHSETEWQAAVMSGPPPLGPGAEPWERLMAFGRSRLETTLLHADLIRQAGRAGHALVRGVLLRRHARALPARRARRHRRPAPPGHRADGPLEAPVLDQQVRIEGLDVDRVYAGWVDLARRIVGSRT